MHTKAKPPRVAFLGPEGTYSHQIARGRFGPDAEYIKRDTISDVFLSLPSEVDYGILPKENSIQGIVHETYDRLCDESAGTSQFIQEEITLRVSHCLLVRRGVKLEDITRVFSHEQALGQCSNFLDRHLSQATLVKTNSTAAAAKSLLEETKEALRSAAIGSEMNTIIHPALVVLSEGIQNKSENFTYFWVISRLTTSTAGHQTGQQFLLRIRPSPHSPGDLDVSSLLQAQGLYVVRVDHRPSHSSSYLDTQFAEVKLPSGGGPTEAHDPLRINEELDTILDRVKQMGYDVKLLGAWDS